MTLLPGIPSRSRILFLALLVAITATVAYGADPHFLVYVGTYTDSDSKGIYSFEFDPVSGDSSRAGLAVESPNPSFLAVDSSGSYLYAVNETDVFEGNMTGGISVFAIDQGNGKLKMLQQVSSIGTGPAHLSLDKSERFLMVANYDGGNVAVLPIENDGKLGPRTAFVQDSGSSANKERQSAPHAHEILATADNRFVLVPDLGTDELLVYRLDPMSGSLTANKPPFAKVSPGSGPRHFAMAPSGKFLYLVNELSSTVDAFSFGASSGQLRKLQSISTLPTGFSGKNTTAEIAVDTAGKFVYVSNRGDDSIAVFAVAATDGKLTFVERVSTGGKEPRHFTLDPTGKWLLAANQNSGTINVFAVDSATGKLTATSHVIRVPTPVCIVFVPAR